MSSIIISCNATLNDDLSNGGNYRYHQTSAERAERHGCNNEEK